MQVLLNDKIEFSKTIEGKYEQIKLPHNVNLNHGFYRLVFPYSQSYKNKRLFIELTNLKGEYTLFFNKKIINNKSEITKLLKKRENELLIELKDADSISFKADVILDIKENTYIENINLKQTYDNGFNIKCMPKISGELLGDETIDVFLYDDDTLLYKTSFSALLKEYTFNVGELSAWQKDNLKFYKCIFKLNEDEYDLDLGFRYLTNDEDNLCLNNHDLKLLAAHYDWYYPYLERYITPALFEHDLKLISEVGINTLIVSEYNETLFKLCDINGINIIITKDVICDRYHTSVLMIKDEKGFNLYDQDSSVTINYLSNNPNINDFLTYINANSGLFLADDIFNQNGIYDINRNLNSLVFNKSSLAFFDLNNKIGLVSNYDSLNLYYKNDLIYSEEFKDKLLLINDINYLIMKNKEDLSAKVYKDLIKLFIAFDYSYPLDIIDKLNILKLKYFHQLDIEKIQDLYRHYSGISVKKEDLNFELIKGETKLNSSKKAKNLKLCLSSSTLTSTSDLALVHVYAVDENGLVDKTFNDIVSVDSDTKVKIIGAQILPIIQGSCSFLVKAQRLGKGIIKVSNHKLAKNEEIELKIVK